MSQLQTGVILRVAHIKIFLAWPSPPWNHFSQRQLLVDRESARPASQKTVEAQVVEEGVGQGGEGSAKVCATRKMTHIFFLTS